MKKTIKLVAVFVIIATLALTLVSCKMLSGEYSNKLAGTYEFSGNKFTYEPLLGDTIEGKYKIEEDQDDPDKLVIIFTYEVEGEEKQDTYSFAEGEENGVKYIRIGIATYEKKD